jgi:hypothetical protein
MVDKKDETVIDPNFFLPPNVYDFRYVDSDQAGSDSPTDAEDNTVEGDPIVNPESDTTIDTAPEENSQLPIPYSITVVSQTVKAAAGGGYLVDIVIDIPDMSGVESYDVAVTKA